MTSTDETHRPDVRALAFDGLAMQAAVIDPEGVITAVNEAWRLFLKLNGGVESTAGVGTNYLETCSRAVASGGEDRHYAKLAAQGISEVCEGSRPEFEMEYPCPSPSERRWFLLRCSPLPGDPPIGAVVAHLDITRRKRLERRLEHSATHDPLTGVANREVLHNRLSLALDRGRSGQVTVTVFFCDLDGFKRVNDALGHASGDQVLSMAASRLEGSLRTGDLLARVGGDEFVIVCETSQPLRPQQVAERIEATFSAPFQLGSNTVDVGVSVGWAVGSAGNDPVDLLHEADAHMYGRKTSKRRLALQSDHHRSCHVAAEPRGNGIIGSRPALRSGSL